MEVVHTPVLLEETVKYLAPRKAGELMIDATIGEGGHSYAFLCQFPELRVIGIDADPEILKTSRERLKQFGERVKIFRQNKGISAYELGLRIGRDTSYMYKVESGRVNVSLKTIYDICEELEISPKELFD